MFVYQIQVRDKVYCTHCGKDYEKLRVCTLGLYLSKEVALARVSKLKAYDAKHGQSQIFTVKRCVIKDAKQYNLVPNK